MSQFLSEYITESSKLMLFVDNIDTELPRLLTNLDENVNTTNLSLIVKFLFGQDSVLKCISNEELESKLLKLSLHFFQKNFSKNLNKVLQIIENPEHSCEEICFNLCEILQVCVNILGGYHDILVHVQSVSCLEAKYLGSVINTLPGILLETFTHCQESECSYGSYFQAASEILSTFFRKSYDLSVLFYKILDEQISFDCSLEKDVCLLVTALELLCRIGQIVVNLDNKTLVEQWKGLAKLLTKYSPYIKDRLNVTQPIKFLISCIDKSITAVSNEEEEFVKQRSRNLKLGSFILKIVVKLAEVYRDYLDTCMNDLLCLLLLLNRCSRLSENNYNVELDRFIVIGAGPLLSHLAKDQQFIEVFQSAIISYDQWTSKEEIGLFYTHLRLFKFLINSTDSEIKSKWLGVPLIPSIIKLFLKDCKHLDLTRRIEDNDTYTMLVSLTVAYMISNFDSGHFNTLEHFFYTKLLGPDVEVGILVSDILTLLCRLTNEDVCLKHTKYLFVVLSQIGSIVFRPELPLARTTAARLYSLLSKEGQEAIKRDFPLDTIAWRHTQQTSGKQLTPVPKFNIENITSPKKFNYMLENLFLRCQWSKKCESLLNDSLIENFKGCLLGFRCCSNVSELHPDWWYNLFYTLTKCLEPLALYLLRDGSFEQVLGIFSELTAIGQPSTFCHISGALAAIFSRIPLQQITNESQNKVASIFKLCFSSGNILITQLVTERFISIDSLSNSEIIYELDEGSQKCVQDFLQKQLVSCPNCPLYSYQINFLHKCKIFHYDSVSSPPNKKFKSDAEESSVSDAIKKLKVEVDNCVACAKQNGLSVEDRQLLRKILFTLEKL